MEVYKVGRRIPGAQVWKSATTVAPEWVREYRIGVPTVPALNSKCLYCFRDVFMTVYWLRIWTNGYEEKDLEVLCCSGIPYQWDVSGLRIACTPTHSPFAQRQDLSRFWGLIEMGRCPSGSIDVPDGSVTCSEVTSLYQVSTAEWMRFTMYQLKRRSKTAAEYSYMTEIREGVIHSLC